MHIPVEYAVRALDYVRERIKPNYSYNKRLPGQDGHHDSLLEKIQKMRNDYNTRQYKKDSYIAAGIIALERGIGNCIDASYAALAYLDKIVGYHDVDIVELKNADHGFLVTGASLQNTYTLPFALWHPLVAICDPWADIATSAINYPGRWRARMWNWQIMDMQLLSRHAGTTAPTGDYWFNAPDGEKRSKLRPEI